MNREIDSMAAPARHLFLGNDEEVEIIRGKMFHPFLIKIGDIHIHLNSKQALDLYEKLENFLSVYEKKITKKVEPNGYKTKTYFGEYFGYKNGQIPSDFVFDYAEIIERNGKYYITYPNGKKDDKYDDKFKIIVKEMKKLFKKK